MNKKNEDIKGGQLFKQRGRMEAHNVNLGDLGKEENSLLSRRLKFHEKVVNPIEGPCCAQSVDLRGLLANWKAKQGRVHDLLKRSTEVPERNQINKKNIMKRKWN